MTTDAFGNAAVPLPVPNAPALRGVPFFAQWAVDDPAGGLVAGGRAFALSMMRAIIPW